MSCRFQYFWIVRMLHEQTAEIVYRQKQSICNSNLVFLHGCVGVGEWEGETSSCMSNFIGKVRPGNICVHSRVSSCCKIACTTELSLVSSRDSLVVTNRRSTHSLCSFPSPSSPPHQSFDPRSTCGMGKWFSYHHTLSRIGNKFGVTSCCVFSRTSLPSDDCGEIHLLFL